MSFQDGARRVATRPAAAGLLIALTAPILGLCPVLALHALGLGPGESMLFDLGAPWTLSMAYALIGVPSVIAGLLAALAIRKNGSISAPHWRAVTGILTLAWITLLGMYVKFQPASLLLTVIVYVIAAAIFASWALRLMIIKLRWMRKPARDIFRVVH
jgi:hypothetical protein